MNRETSIPLPVMLPKDADGKENSVDPDQTAPLRLHFSRPICPKTSDHYCLPANRLHALEYLTQKKKIIKPKNIILFCCDANHYN